MPKTVQATGVSPWMALLMSLAAAVLASALTLTVPSLYNPGVQSSLWLKFRLIKPNLNPSDFLVGLRLLSEATQRIRDSSGAITAVWLLTVITVLAVRTISSTYFRLSLLFTQALRRARTR